MPTAHAHATPRRHIAERLNAETSPNYNHTTRGTLTERFNNAWQHAVEGIITAGRVLIQAKEEFPHGEFLDWLKDDLRLDVSKAERLMLIARHPVLSNSAHWADLPPSWRTLYVLTQLCRPNQNPQRMLDLITSGKINPFMTREEASALLTGRKQDDGKLIFSADLARVMRLLNRLTDEEAIANLRADPGSITKASVRAFCHRLHNIAEQLD